MLSLKEREIMKQIYDAAKGNMGCVLSVEQIIAGCNPKLKIDAETVVSALHHLEYDGYYELTESEKKGQPVYVFNLKAKGAAFEREMEQQKRDFLYNLIVKVVICAAGAVVGVIITKLISCGG